MPRIVSYRNPNNLKLIANKLLIDVAQHNRDKKRERARKIRAKTTIVYKSSTFHLQFLQPKKNDFPLFFFFFSIRLRLFK